MLQMQDSSSETDLGSRVCLVGNFKYVYYGHLRLSGWFCTPQSGLCLPLCPTPLLPPLPLVHRLTVRLHHALVAV